jgi:hypothetical protein
MMTEAERDQKVDSEVRQKDMGVDIRIQVNEVGPVESRDAV